MGDRYNALPAKSVTTSPVEHTLNLLQERLFHAEGETNKLAKQLVSYGFKRLPDDRSDSSSRSSNKENIPLSYDRAVSRLCKMESMITSLTAGLESLEAEKSSTVSQLMAEKTQILENYSHQLQQTKEEVEKQKQGIAVHEEAKVQLEKQISKLKKEMLKRVENGKLLTDKLKERDMELQAFQTKFSEVSKQLSNELSSRKRMEDSHASLELRVQEMQTVVESERAKVDTLNEKCLALTEDAVLARGEFEKEFNCRLRVQDIMAVHDEEIKTANQNLEKYEEDNRQLANKLQASEESLVKISSDNEKLKGVLDSATVENEGLKQALKKAAIDNQALVNQTKEALVREKSKVDHAIQQQGKILDSAKESLLTELNKEQKHSQQLETENLRLSDKITELTTRNSEQDFKLKMMQQTTSNETTRLQNILTSSEKAKEDLSRQLKQKEKELVEMNSNWMKEKSTLMEKYQDISRSLQKAEQRGDSVEREKEELSEKLSWINIKQHSHENIEVKLNDMMAEKKKMAYENGLMQSKVANLEAQLNNLRSVEEEKQKLLSKVESFDSEQAEMKLNWSKIDGDLQSKTSELQKVLQELDLNKTKLQSTEVRLKQVTDDYNEAVQQVETLIKQAENVHNKHEHEIDAYESRLVSVEKERVGISSTMESLMSTNNVLQKELELSQSEVGRKDARIEELLDQVHDSQCVIDQLQAELRGLSKQINKLDYNENVEISNLKEDLKVEISEKCVAQSKVNKQKQDMDTMKNTIKKLKEEYKAKENELKDYINAKHTDLAKVREQHNNELNAIKEEYRKEINKLKRQIHEHIALSRHKEADRVDSKTTLKTLWEQFKTLEDDKKAYVEKNLKQAKLLDEFMSQIADLQNELSNIIKTQTDMDAKLKEKEKLIAVEKKKRHDVEQKYKYLLKGQQNSNVSTNTITNTHSSTPQHHEQSSRKRVEVSTSSYSSVNGSGRSHRQVTSTTCDES